tara:strand:+ start:67 stop:1008 length:942 start_codon:yes stop_codon:yes gene_type:complete
MKTILIGTTSINRPKLHTNNIPEWYNWVKELDKTKYDIHWFINIDMIEMLNFTYKETKENYETIITDIPVTFLQSEGYGNFLKACQRLSQTIEKYVKKNNLNEEEVIIFWLEDDWKLHKNIVFPLAYIIENYMSNMCVINLTFLTKNYIHALAPGLLNYKLWKELHLKAWKKQKDHTDPESCVGKYYLKNFQSKYNYINNITIIDKYPKKIHWKNEWIRNDPMIDKNNNLEFNISFLHPKNSYYTYNIKDNSNIIQENYIKKEDIKIKFKNIVTFMRITTRFCDDLGRNDMKKYNLEKKRIQNNSNINFYIRK